MSLSIEITLDYMAIPALQVWELLRDSHRQLFGDSATVELCRERYRVADVADAIGAMGKPYLGIRYGKAEVDYCPIGNCAIDLAILERLVQDADDAAAWVQPFLGLKAFREARFYN